MYSLYGDCWKRHVIFIIVEQRAEFLHISISHFRLEWLNDILIIRTRIAHFIRSHRFHCKVTRGEKEIKIFLEHLIISYLTILLSAQTKRSLDLYYKLRNFTRMQETFFNRKFSSSIVLWKRLLIKLALVYSSACFTLGFKSNWCWSWRKEEVKNWVTVVICFFSSTTTKIAAWWNWKCEYEWRLVVVERKSYRATFIF